MDISAYWQSIKKQSKELTGVKKMDSGIFHSSGIGGKLEDYIAAVKKGDPKKIEKTAAVALDKTQKYLDQIHKKEMKEGKKAMSAQELKSAKIVGDALEKIVDQLQKVVSGEALAGSFDGDATADAKDSADRYIDPKLKKAADAHMELRRKVSKEAPKLLASMKSDFAQAEKYAKLAEQGAKDAAKTKREGDTFNNRQAIDQAVRAVEEMQKLRKALEDDYKKNVVDGSSDFMKARQDFRDKHLLPDWMRDKYLRDSGALFLKGNEAALEMNKLRREFDQLIAAAEGEIDKAEQHSMAAVDPAKIVGKVDKITQDLEKAGDAVEKVVGQVSKLPDRIKQAMGFDVAAAEKLKQMDLYTKIVERETPKVVDALKTTKTLNARLKTFKSGAEDRDVVAAIGRAEEAMQAVAKSAEEFKTAHKDAVEKIQEAKVKLKSETVG